MVRKRMGRRWCSLLFALSLAVPARLAALFEEDFYGARSFGLANAVSGIGFSPEQLDMNPAALCSPARLTAQISYSRPYDLPDITSGRMHLLYSRSSLATGLSLASFGNDIYNESSFLVAGALKLGTRSSMGLSVSVNRLSIKGYGNSSTILFNMGVLTELASGLRWGAAVKNLTESRIGQGREKLPQEIRSGLCYSPVRQLNLLFDLVKDERFPIDMRFAAEYAVVPVFTLRAGLGAEPAQYSFGFGVDFGFGGIDYGLRNHDSLGYSHLFSIVFRMP